MHATDRHSWRKDSLPVKILIVTGNEINYSIARYILGALLLETRPVDKFLRLRCISTIRKLRRFFRTLESKGLRHSSRE